MFDPLKSSISDETLALNIEMHIDIKVFGGNDDDAVGRSSSSILMSMSVEINLQSLMHQWRYYP